MADVRIVSAEHVRPLRAKILRPGLPLADSVYPTDDIAHHLAAYVDDRIVAVATFFVEPAPHDPSEHDWRLRGMAADDGFRGQGHGAVVFERVVEVIREKNAQRLWCNARESARGFYERQGMGIVGERFELPNIGAHYVMTRAL